MAQFLFGPKEFFGIDIVFDILVFLILGSIFFITYKFYRLSFGKREYLFFSASFFLLAMSFLARIFTYCIIYFYDTLKLNQVEILNTVASMPIHGMRGSYFFFSAGIAMYGFLYLVGLYILYLVYQENKNLSDFVIILFCFFMITYFSHNQYFAFHITAMVMFLLMTYRYFQVFLKNQRNSTLAITFSFIILGISQAFFIFKEKIDVAYIMGESLQLVGFISFILVILYLFISAKKKVKKGKKSKDGKKKG